MAVQNKISVIVPCFNVEAYISECLESIVQQEYKNLEIICINDGSKDCTLEVLRKFQKKDNRIIIIDQENSGLSQSRNAGISVCSGNWLMFVDSDDWLDRQMIGKTFRLEDETDMYCCSYQRVFKNRSNPRQLGLSGYYSAAAVRLRMVGLTGIELSDPSQADSIVTAWAKIYKTEIIKNKHIRFIDTKEIGTEDALFNIQYLRYAKKVFILDEPLYYYRRSNVTSLTSVFKHGLLIKWKTLYKRIENDIKDDDELFKAALRNRICLGVLGLCLNEVLSDQSFLKKRRNIKVILNDSLYIKSFQNFRTHVMPIHWKLFYTFAKMRKALPLLLLSTLINKLIYRRN